MSLRIFARRGGRRPAALLSVAAVAATVLVSTAVGANAAITRGAGVTADGLPSFFSDSQGIALAPCDAGAKCGGAFDPTDATYFGSDTQLGPIRAVNSLTAGVGPRGGVTTSQISRYTGSGLTPGRYTIKDPWGTLNTCTADATGKMDCRVAARRITSFLIGTRGGPGFIGNSAAGSTFTGSPTGFNKFQITGPAGFKTTKARTILTGQMLPNTAMSAINKTALTMGRPHNATPVVRNIRYTSLGTAAAVPTVRMTGANPAAFTVNNPCASVAPGTACNLTVTFKPRQHLNKTVTANLVITDNGLVAPRTVKLTGIGLVR